MIYILIAIVLIPILPLYQHGPKGKYDKFDFYDLNKKDELKFIIYAVVNLVALFIFATTYLSYNLKSSLNISQIQTFSLFVAGVYSINSLVAFFMLLRRKFFNLLFINASSFFILLCFVLKRAIPFELQLFDKAIYAAMLGYVLTNLLIIRIVLISFEQDRQD